MSIQQETPFSLYMIKGFPRIQNMDIQNLIYQRFILLPVQDYVDLFEDSYVDPVVDADFEDFSVDFVDVDFEDSTVDLDFEDFSVDLVAVDFEDSSVDFVVVDFEDFFADLDFVYS